jgi:8-oxo-dGTP diphosphatase
MAQRSDHGPPLLFVVAAALLDAEGRVLITRRPDGKRHGGLWEFPGGKPEVGESPEEALVRELAEELGIVVAVEALEPFAFVSHAEPDFHLLMPLWLVRHWSGNPVPREGQAMEWSRIDRLRDYSMPPADGPLVVQLEERLR